MIKFYSRKSQNFFPLSLYINLDRYLTLLFVSSVPLLYTTDYNLLFTSTGLYLKVCVIQHIPHARKLRLSWSKVHFKLLKCIYSFPHFTILCLSNFQWSTLVMEHFFDLNWPWCQAMSDTSCCVWKWTKQLFCKPLLSVVQLGYIIILLRPLPKAIFYHNMVMLFHSGCKM